MVAYLIFVASISSSASVKSFDLGEFFTMNAKATPDRSILFDIVLSGVKLFIVCKMTHFVQHHRGYSCQEFLRVHCGKIPLSQIILH